MSLTSLELGLLGLFGLLLGLFAVYTQPAEIAIYPPDPPKSLCSQVSS